MQSENIIADFLENFFSNDSENVCYVTAAFEFFENIEILKENNVFVIDLKDNYSPLAPFLQILKHLSPSKECLGQNVFPIFLPAFLGYITEEKVPLRTDDIILKQTFYEVQECRSSVLKLLLNLPSKNFLILNSQFLCEESIKIIEEIEKSSVKSKFIFSFDAFQISSVKDSLAVFVEKIQNQNNYIQVIDNIKKSDSEPKSLKKIYKNFSSFLICLQNIRAFRSLDQQLKLNHRIIKRMNSYKFSKEQYQQLVYEIAMNFYTAGDTNNALIYFNMALNSQKTDFEYLKTLYYLGCTYFERRVNAKAAKYAALVLQKLKNEKDSILYAYALRLLYISSDRDDTDFLISKYRESCLALKKLNLLVNYANTLSNIPTCFLDRPEVLRQSLLPEIFETIKSVQPLKNDFILAEAYNDLGFIYDILKEHEEAKKYYVISSSLREKIGEVSFIIEQLNHFSYSFLISSDYKNAYDILKPFAPRLTELKEFGSISDTLRNLTLPLFYARNFETAYKLFNLIIYIIKLFNFDKAANNSYIPEITNMIIYKAIIDVANGDYIHAEISFNNILHSKNHYSQVLKPYLYYIRAASFLKSGNLQEALSFFEEGFIHFGIVTEVKDHLEVFILYEFSRLLKKFNYQKESEEFFDRGFKIAKKYNLRFYTKNKENLTLEEFDKNFEDFGPLNFDIDYIKSVADKEKITNDLHSKGMDSQFLNKIIYLSTEIKPLKTFVKNVLKSILDYTVCDAVYYIEKTDNSWESQSIVSNSEKKHLPEKNEYYFTLSDSRDFVYDSFTSSYVANLSKYRFTLGFIIVPNEKNKISYENFQTLNIALSIIQNKLIMKMQQESLMTISTVDTLTGLNNRANLIEHIEILEKQISRLEQKNKSVPLYTICFIDLDNFKYYNDSFGHKAGDILLKKFSSLLKDVFRQTDFIARFGGDEFLIIMQGTSTENAKLLAERIYKSLEMNNYFVPDLEHFLNKKLRIPHEKLLNFSMGLCSNFDLDDPKNLTEVIKFADSAMYSSKQSGKGRCTIWKKV